MINSQGQTIRTQLVKCRVVYAATAALLQDAITAFMAEAGERILLDVQFELDGGVYAAMILYTE